MVFGFLYKFFYPFAFKNEIESNQAFKDEVESNQQPCTKKRKKEDGIESNQQPCTKKQKKEGLVFGDDRISELPDDVILTILSFLSLRDVVSTSLLSTRYLDLWKQTPNLDFFDADDLYRIRSYTEHDSWDVGMCKYVKMVNSVIESHQALFLKHFKLNFYVNQSAQSVVAKWLGFVWSRQVQRLDLNFRCESVKHAVVLQDLVGEMRPMKYLQDLSLMMMKLRGEDISLFLNNCPYLRKLRIVQSFLTSDVHISGATLALEDLWILASHFSGSVIINISAPNLSKVHVDARPGQLWFKNVPRLAEACLRISCPSYPMHHFTSTLSCLTSQLHTLTLYGPDADKLLGRGFPQLPNLKQLFVEDTFLLPVTHVISACPRLQLFFFRCPDEANDATTDYKRYKLFTFKGSCAANIIQSLTYIEESCAFQKIKNPTSLMSEDDLKQFQAQLYQQVRLQFQVQLSIQLNGYFFRYL